MRRRSIACAAGVLLACAPCAPSYAASTTPVRVQLRWTTGWDSAAEPLDTSHSSVTWTYNPVQATLTVEFSLVHATPSKVYQVGVNIFCNYFGVRLGQFPTSNVGPGNVCTPLAKQGVVARSAEAELGVLTTDINGDGVFSVEIAPFTPPALGDKVEFFVRNGTGCNLANASGDADCAVDFQSPGPEFGNTTTIIAP